MKLLLKKPRHLINHFRFLKLRNAAVCDGYMGTPIFNTVGFIFYLLFIISGWSFFIILMVKYKKFREIIANHISLVLLMIVLTVIMTTVIASAVFMTYGSGYY